MDARKKHYGYFKSLGRGATLRFRLTVLIVLAVLTVLGVGITVDYRREYRVHLESVMGSLEEQARGLKAARSHIAEKVDFAQYVDDFCAQMNEYISPGHHILVLDDRGSVSARAWHHSGAEVENALLAVDPQEKVICVGKHRLAQVRLEDDGTTIILAQYLDHMEEILATQLISRGLTTAATALAVIFSVYLVINAWVIKPVANLSSAAKQWAARNFSARSGAVGPREFRLLASEFNSMAKQLEGHENGRIAELEQARQIQANLLPVTQPSARGLSVVAEYRPAEHVAGDLYDIFSLTDGNTAFVVLDVCGHGISAALLTGVVKMSLHRRLAEGNDLSVCMKHVNSDLLSCVPEGRFVTVCVGVWNAIDRSWTYCAAGHPGGVLLRQSKAETLEATGPLLGVFADEDWSTHTINLSSGDRLFLYTDGVLDAVAAKDALHVCNLEEILLDGAGLELVEQVATLMEEAASGSSDNIKDDVTIVAFEVVSEAVA